MTRPAAQEGVEFARDYHKKVKFAAHLGIEQVALEPGVARMCCALQPHMTNSWGIAHGGVVMTLLDVAMGHAARSLSTPAQGVATIDATVSFIREGRGKLVAEGRALRGGRSIVFCEGEIRDAGGELVAKAIGTFKVRRPAASSV